MNKNTVQIAINIPVLGLNINPTQIDTYLY